MHTTNLVTRLFLFPLLFTSILLIKPALAQPRTGDPGVEHAGGGESGMLQRLNDLRDNPLLLRDLLKRMPKGADLHNHLSGAVYAESFLKWAAESNFFIDTSAMVVVAAGSGTTLPASKALFNAGVYRRIIDAWSMRNWELSGESGHDHFFNTFGKFGLATKGRVGDMLAEVATRGADNGLLYQELMLAPDTGAVSRLGAKLNWRPDYVAMRDELLRMGLRDSIRVGMRVLDDAERRMREIMRCGKGDSASGCGMTIRYLYQVGRGGAEPSVFAQIVAGFEMAEMDPRVVGFNLVQPEDDPVPMYLFTSEMEMINALRPLYKAAHISLHAGEFAYGMIPPDSLCCHIRSSIELGHAERIGHGVDVMYEDMPIELLKLMKSKDVLVEICLTSNDGILGVRGNDHPFRIYRSFDIPLALCTDDEGVSRGDITNEYLRAVREQSASYQELKQMARNSLEYAFVGGKSIWRDRTMTAMVPECSGSTPGGKLTSACKTYLEKNEKARLQWKLEERLGEFER